MQEFKGWKDELQKLIDKHNAIRVNGKDASHKTQKDRAEFLFAFFKVLRSKGYACDPHNLKLKHVRVYCEHMEEKGLSAATIQNYVSYIKLFCRWIGKAGMVVDYKQFFKNEAVTTRSYQAVTDKSWTGNNIDVKQKLLEIKQESLYVWIQLLMQHAFGIRRKEAISFRPYMNSRDGNIFITDGPKNGKTRVVPIEHDIQVIAIEEAIKIVGNTSMHLGDPKFDLKQNIAKYERTMAKHKITKKDLGATGHGLRAEYALDLMEMFGLTPLVRGGEVGQLPKDQETQVRLEVSQRLGHNRVGITTAYSGPLSEAGKRMIDKEKSKQEENDSNETKN